MAPGKKMRSSVRRSSMPSPSQLSPSETVAPSDQPQNVAPSDQPQNVAPQNSDALADALSLAQSTNAGQPPSTRKRGKTVGKGVERLIAQNGAQKLFVPVLEEWNSLCGIHASKATSLLGVYLRKMCPVKDTPTWRHVDQATQSAIIQAVLDKCKISDDYHENPIAQQAVHRKCYHLHINWRHKMKCHYNDLVEQQLDLYSHPYDQMTLEDWRHMIDDVWASDKHKNRSSAGKENRKAVDFGRCSGSRSFVAEMTIPVENGGSENKDFPEVFQKTHTNKDNEWISDICSDKHAEMLHVREENSQSGMQLTREEMSREVLGKRKKYILGFGVGPKPSSSTSNAASRARDEEFLTIKAAMEKMQMERDEEKTAREAEMEKLRTEREEEKRAREIEMEKLWMEREEEKRAREAEREEEKRACEAEMEKLRMEREEEKRSREAEMKKFASLVTQLKHGKNQTHSTIHHGGHISLTGGHPYH